MKIGKYYEADVEFNSFIKSKGGWIKQLNLFAIPDIPRALIEVIKPFVKLPVQNRKHTLERFTFVDNHSDSYINQGEDRIHAEIEKIEILVTYKEV